MSDNLLLSCLEISQALIDTCVEELERTRQSINIRDTEDVKRWHKENFYQPHENAKNVLRLLDAIERESLADFNDIVEKSVIFPVDSEHALALVLSHCEIRFLNQGGVWKFSHFTQKRAPINARHLKPEAI